MKIASQQKDNPKPITNYFVWLRKDGQFPFKVEGPHEGRF